MTYIELDEAQRGLTRSQTINSVVISAVAVLLVGVGLLMRNSAAAATQPFLHEGSGIRAQLPLNWLVTTDDPGFVVQAEDASAIPFKTLLRVSLEPVGAEATPRNVVDTLTLQRSGRLSSYRVLSTEATTIGEDEALEMDYAYVQTESNPALNAVPIVVRGRDVVVIRGNQAVVITYLEERSRFEENENQFDRFLDTLEF
ncbi:MAG TPA: hypothetical protein VJZ27_14530 [Aggregatilineales bacterium]|nr:hypothetical protein [Aggregatilineales bacterium]